MSSRLETGYEELEAALAAAVDDACDAFETAWSAAARDGSVRPEIEAACDSVAAAARASLLRELVAFEFGARQRAGESPTPAEYERRFPELDANWLERVAIAATAGAQTKLAGATPLIQQLALNVSGKDGVRRLGKFELRRELGRGGYGVVHLAYEPLLGREVALKVPHEHVLADAELRLRFQREARAAAGLNHPNIVPVHEAGEVDSVAYIALAYCPGITLHDWLRQHDDSIPGPVIGEFVATLADAIHHAHEQGIVHRDLKPANVLLVGDIEPETAAAKRPPPSLASLVPKITDFGLAKHLDGDDARTRTGTLAGTPCYMAPEQTGSGRIPIGPATDVYALGAILYELLTGRAPFQGETVLDTLDQVRHQDPVPPRQLRPGLPRDLEIVCLKCLEKDPSRRYASAKLLADDLRRYLSGHSILARPSGPLTQVAKWAVRRPAAAGLVAACAVVAALLVASDLYIRQKNREIRTALEGETKARKSLGQSLVRERQTLYYQRIRLAQAALDDSNARQAERYLAACLPVPGEADVRGWEWHYLKRQCHQELLDFREHACPVRDVALRRDGRECASLGSDGTILGWDAESGAVAWRLRMPQQTDITNNKIEYAPSGDLIAVSDAHRNTVVVFAVPAGQRLCTLAGSELCFERDGTRLAVIDGPQRVVRLYDPASGKLLATAPRKFAEIHAMAFRANNFVLASAGGDGVIRVWEGESDQPRELSAPQDQRFMLEFSDDGRFLATKGFSGTVQIWDVASGADLASFTAHHAAVNSLAFQPLGQHLASADLLGTIKTWDLRGRLLRSLPGHGTIIGRIRLSEDGRRLVSASSDRTVKVWDLARDQEATVFRGHVGFAFAAAFAPDGQHVASAGREGSVRIWSAASGRALGQFADDIVLRHLVYRPDAMLVGCDAAGAVYVWNPRSGEQLTTLPGTPAKNLALAALSQVGGYFAVASSDRQSVAIRDVATGRTLSTVRSPSPVQALCFTGDEQALAVATEDGIVSMYDSHTSRRLTTLACGDVRSLAISRDGRKLAIAGSSEHIQIWDVTSGKQEHLLQSRWGRSNVYSLAFSSDGRRLASGGWGAAVTLWDMQSGEEIFELPTHYMGVTALAFSQDGLRLAAIINDGTITVWDAAP